MARLSTFCEIAAAGGISKAAGGLPHRQSQFSRQLKELEQHLGTQLLRRGGTLTEAGFRLRAACEPLLNTLDKVAADLSSSPVTVSIGSGESIINWWLLPKLEKLSSQLVNVRWKLSNLRTGAIDARLLDSSLDLGILRRDGCSSEIKCRPLYTMRFSLCIPRRAEKLRRIPGAVLTGGGKLASDLEAIMSRIDPRFEPRLFCDSSAQVKHAIESCGFAGVLPTIAATTLPATEFLISTPPDLSRVRRDYVLAWKATTVTMRPLLKEVCDEFEGLRDSRK